MKKVVHQAYKFRIYPDKTQIQVLHQHFGSCRFVYNHFLNERIEFYQQNKDKKPSLLNPKSKKSLNYSWAMLWDLPSSKQLRIGSKK